MNKNRFRLRLVALTTLLSAVIVASVNGAIELPAGTEVQIVFGQDVSSKYVAPGQLLPIHLQGTVEVGGIIVVKDGAKGSALVKSVQPAGKGGKPGRVEVVLVELEPNGAYKAEGDIKVALEAITGDDTGIIKAEGKGRKTMSYLFIFGLFIKGTEGVIEADKPYPAKIKEDINILVE